MDDKIDLQMLATAADSLSKAALAAAEAPTEGALKIVRRYRFLVDDAGSFLTKKRGDK